MNIYDSDELDRGTYDDLGQQHYHESLDWSDNIFGESIPGSDDTAAADADDDDDMEEESDVTPMNVADEDTEGDDSDEDES